MCMRSVFLTEKLNAWYANVNIKSDIKLMWVQVFQQREMIAKKKLAIHYVNIPTNIWNLSKLETHR